MNVHVISCGCGILRHQHYQLADQNSCLRFYFYTLHTPNISSWHHICQNMWQITSDCHDTSSLSVTLRRPFAVGITLEYYDAIMVPAPFSKCICTAPLMSPLFMHRSEAIGTHWPPAVLNNKPETKLASGWLIFGYRTFTPRLMCNQFSADRIVFCFLHSHKDRCSKIQFLCLINLFPQLLVLYVEWLSMSCCVNN